MAVAIRTKDDIFAILGKKEAEIKALGVKRLGLFGSFVRGEQRENSDVDLLVEFDASKKSFDNFIELCFLLEAALNRRVELVTTEALSPHLGPHILQEVEYAPLAA
jgi:predicted nucleotidyltransferase